LKGRSDCCNSDREIDWVTLLNKIHFFSETGALRSSYFPVIFIASILVNVCYTDADWIWNGSICGNQNRPRRLQQVQGVSKLSHFRESVSIVATQTQQLEASRSTS